MAMLWGTGLGQEWESKQWHGSCFPETEMPRFYGGEEKGVGRAHLRPVPRVGV